MKKKQMRGPLGAMLGEQVVRLTKREIAALRRAQVIAEQIRDNIEDEDSNLDMVCAQIEHGVAELLDEIMYEDGEFRLD